MTGREQTIAVAMSGGVDSSVTACLLREQGFSVHGMFMALAQPDLAAQVERAHRVADKLDIPLEIIDLKEVFEQQVLDYFTESYRAGRTPNPCMICNPMVKFGRLLEEVTARGFDRMATGHYARLLATGSGRMCLLKGVDASKDQSYFLARLAQSQLARLVFPLGEHEKRHVYELAARFGIAGVHGRESQDVCFLKETSVAEYLAMHGLKDRPGPVLTRSGGLLGGHHGVHHFTIGQRRGLGIPDATPWYVVGLDAARNAVLVGKQDELFSQRLVAGRVCWTQGETEPLPARFEVSIRYRGLPANAEVRLIGSDRVEILFDAPQRAVTPGQFAVFYSGDMVVGSAEIEAPSIPPVSPESMNQ